MNLHHLEYFLAVARTGSFTLAARQVHLTQPTVSAGIAELERTLGVRLFHRQGRRVCLTMEGRALIGYAEQVHDLVGEARDRLTKGDLVEGEGFQVGATDAAVIYLLPGILRRYHEAFPKVAVSINVASSRYLVEDVLNSRSEFAVITLPCDHARIQTVAIYQDTMPLVVAADHRFSAKRGATLAEVVKETLILFHPESVSRHVVDEELVKAGVSPGALMEMGSPEAMRKLVEAGVGVSFLPRLTVAESLEEGRLREVRVAGVSLSRDIGVAWRKGRYFAPAVRRLIDMILEAYGKLQSP